MSTPMNGETESECLEKDITRHDEKVKILIQQHQQELDKFNSIRAGMIRKLINLQEKEKTFMGLCIAGKETPDSIDDYVDKWHSGSSHLGLVEFLGMTNQEYGEWVKKGDPVLEQIINDRKQ